LDYVLLHQAFLLKKRKLNKDAKRSRRQAAFFFFSIIFCLPELKECFLWVGNCSSFARLAFVCRLCVPCKCAVMCGGQLETLH